MVNLIIDIGNTFSKILVFRKEDIIYIQKQEQFFQDEIEALVKRYNVERILVSSVKGESPLPVSFVSGIEVVYFDYKTPVPIKNKYGTPETLGVDRLAGIIGAKNIFPQKAVLVFDFGSCLTVDFADEEGNYFGGVISPGLKMRFNAMHSFTDKLPLIDVDESVYEFEKQIGENTTESLMAGVINGMLFEIQGYIKKYNEKKIDLGIILCGGDASFFDSRLKNSIFAHQILLEPNLVPIGLNTVVRYQHDKKDK